jgi:serine/threonine protein phosphatase PrpC
MEDPFVAITTSLPAGGSVSACGVSHMRGMRADMEDAHSAHEVAGSPFYLLSVFDGHGGRGMADFAASRLLAAVTATREWAAAAAAGFCDDGAVAAALRAGFADCDAAAYAALAGAGDRSGSTAIVALVSPRRVFVANCGDSRAVLVRAAGAEALSTDHKPDAHAERARLAARAGAASRGGGYFAGLAVSRTLGDFRTKLDHARAAPHAPPPLLPASEQTVTSAPEVVVVERAAAAAAAAAAGGDALIVACDGVWDVVSNEEAAACVRASLAGGAAPADAAAALISECLERGSSDNMTAIVALLAD